MPATNAISVKGVVFRRGMTAIAEITGITGPEIARDVLPATQLDAPNGFKEYIAGFKDCGEIVLNMNFTRDGWVDFLADMDTDARVSYSLVMPDTGNTTFSVDAWPVKLGLAMPENDKINMDVTLKVTGGITLSS